MSLLSFTLLSLALVSPASFLPAPTEPAPTGPAPPEPIQVQDTAADQVRACRGLRFVDVTAAAGLDFRHAAGTTPERHLPETMGAGVAWLDFDGDGRWDLYAVQSDRRPPPVGGGHDRLYRNLGAGRFEDVSERVGLPRALQGAAYGMGVTAADVNGDGHSDLYLSNYGPDRLLLARDTGDAGITFVDATADAGLLAADGWSSTAVLADADGDRDLDLYVVRYVDYRPDHGLFCGDPDAVGPEAGGRRGRRDYCHPELFQGTPDLFYRSADDGTFEPVTAAAGLGSFAYRGLGAIFQDLDGDGHIDLYVANDLDLNLLYQGRGDGSFEEVSLLSGTAVNAAGEAEAGMGVATGDVDGDGRPDLMVTHFDVETNTLYRNLGLLQFEDASATSGFGVPSFNQLGFGIAVDDFDFDGDLDVYVANGHILEDPPRGGVEHAQPDLLLAGDERGPFTACPSPDETAGLAPLVGRGLAIADFDDDGDGDLVLSSNGGPLRLLRNEANPPAERWLGVELHGPAPNTAAIGARVVLRLRRGTQTALRSRWITAGDSYQSCSSTRRRFGWPAGWQPVEIEVTWPTVTGQRAARITRVPVEQTGRYLSLEP